jgi:subtilisin family serine protease
LVSSGIEFLNPDPNTTIVMPGTSPGCITCAAYSDQTKALYIRSSWGFTRNMLIKPDLTAPGVDVTGIDTLGEGTMSGTSVACAITTGACALMLQWGIVNQNDVSLNTSRVKAYLIRGCARDANVQYPNAQWGYGRLDLLNTFRLMQYL